MTDATPGDHYRPTDEAYNPGVYRVVGASEEVTLLRVATDDGRRIHTGDVRHVSPRTFDTVFTSADDPDAGFTPVAAVRNLLQGLYWDVRKFF